MAIAPRIGRWAVEVDGSITLIGSRCGSCGEVLFPERFACSRCGGRDLSEARVRGPARLVAHTVVHQAPPSFATPYAVGYGELADGLVVLAPIDGDPAELVHGMPLELCEGVTGTDEDGHPLRTYRYRGFGTGARGA